MKRKKIGIMGGTFNPIHIGHLLLGQQALEDFSLDQILFIPSGYSYMKDQSEMTDKYLRYEMCRLAIAEHPDFLLSDIEIRREGNSYTYETLEELKKEYPEADFFLILGADNIFDLESWKCPERILRNCTLLAAVRPAISVTVRSAESCAANSAEGSDNPEEQGAYLEGSGHLEAQIAYLEHKYHIRIGLLSMPQLEISSTMIRHRLSRNQTVRYMVPDRVLSFILEHDLYQSE